ncbi:MAG: hypothetical protein E7387_00560 [Ruminococcaceae bacterium]|nr:hypothetical protein [Oscillospiraceae bacterium]
MISDVIKSKFVELNQAHVFSFESELSDIESNLLERQLKDIDIETAQKLFNKKEGEYSENSVIEPIPCVIEADLTEEQRNKYIQKGFEIMKNGEYAVVTMAGGQGTRLGHNGPKGTYYVRVPETVSLFEIQCRRIKKRSEECGRNIPWYIMTSEENDSDTKAFFEKNNYFGYPKSEIFFFKQYMLPMLDEEGKLILEEKYRLKEGADGHGGIFRAMLGRGVIEDMNKRGTKWIFTCGIDNILVQLADPCFLGYISSNGYKLGGKSLIKRDPYEKAGVFCKKDGKPFVIEYTEISSEMAELRDDKGEFVYGDAHILCNLFNVEVFEKMGDKGLPYHVAHKKASFVNDKGIKITPEKPNAYKYEAFIFDAFAYYDDMGIFRIKREHEFAPIKNKCGEDSPESAEKLYLDYVAGSGKI